MGNITQIHALLIRCYQLSCHVGGGNTTVHSSAVGAVGRLTLPPDVDQAFIESHRALPFGIDTYTCMLVLKLFFCESAQVGKGGPGEMKVARDT